jgi:hypothetical protein
MGVGKYRAWKGCCRQNRPQPDHWGPPPSRDQVVNAPRQFFELVGGFAPRLMLMGERS